MCNCDFPLSILFLNQQLMFTHDNYKAPLELLCMHGFNLIDVTVRIEVHNQRYNLVHSIILL